MGYAAYPHRTHGAIFGANGAEAARLRAPVRGSISQWERMGARTHENFSEFVLPSAPIVKTHRSPRRGRRRGAEAARLRAPVRAAVAAAVHKRAALHSLHTVHLVGCDIGMQSRVSTELCKLGSLHGVRPEAARIGDMIEARVDARTADGYLIRLFFAGFTKKHIYTNQMSYEMECLWKVSTFTSLLYLSTHSSILCVQMSSVLCRGTGFIQANVQ